MSRPVVLILTVLLVLVLLPSPGCMKCGRGLAEKAAERAIERAVEAGTGGKVDIDAGSSVDVTGLPAEVIYPGAKATAKWTITSKEGTGNNYVFETGDAVAAVAAHYKTAMAGWTSSTTMETAEATVLGYSMGEGQKTAVITIGKKDGGGSTIGVVYMTK